MGIPRKGSRPIAVDNVQYRWMLRGGKGRIIGQSNPSIQFTAQLDVEHPGRVLQSLLLSKLWTGIEFRYGHDHRVSLTPEDVRKLIRYGLSNGWDPHSNGTAIQIEGLELENWSSTSMKPPARPPRAVI